MFSLPPKLPIELQEALAAHESFKAAGAASFRTLCVQRSRFTLLHKINARPGSRDGFFWVKTYLRKPQDAALEYHFLVEAQRLFCDAPELRMVEPVALLEKQASLVTRHACGENLGRKIARAAGLFSSAAQVEQIAQQCRLCGAWLARLHRCRAQDGQSCKLGAVVRQTMQKVRTVNSWLGSIVAPADIENLLRRFAKQATPGELALCRTHGDYGPHNVLTNGAAIVALDPSFPEDLERVSGCCARYEDVARFCCTIEGNTPRQLKSQRRRLWVRSFVQGYNESGNFTLSFGSPVFALFRMKYFLQSMIDWPSLRCRVTLGNANAASLLYWLGLQEPFAGLVDSRTLRQGILKLPQQPIA